MPNYATDGVIAKDVNGTPVEGVYVPNTGTVSAQGGPVTTDNTNEPSAPTVISLSSAVAIPTPADSTAFAGLMPSVRMEQTGTGVASPVRVANVFKSFAAQAITAGTPLAVWTPASGKKFRVLGMSLSSSTASAPILKDGASVILNAPLLAAAGVYTTPSLGNGIVSSATNNVLNLDMSANATVTGFVFGVEE